MFTANRLNKLLKTSPVIYYDCLSRFALMSDCHRGVGDWSDNFLKNQSLYHAALTHYYQNDYTYIELGDGDELWENRDMQKIIEAHSNTFRLLSDFYHENRLYMLYGNHDYVKKRQKFIGHNLKDYYCESECCKIPLMPGICAYESLLLENRLTGHRIFLVHGHQGDILNDILWKLSRFLVRYLWRPLELIAFHDPTSAAKNNSKKGAVERRLSDWASSNSQMLITGHTHRPMFPANENSYYYNCGSCVHPQSVTALEICDEKIQLVKWSMQTREDLGLYVGREILAGPVPFGDRAN